MKNFTGLSVAASLSGALVLGLVFKDSFMVTGFAQNATNPQPSSPAKIMKFGEVNPSGKPRNVQITMNGATLLVTVPPEAALLSEAEHARMLGDVTESFSGKVRISVEEKGKETVVLKADKLTLKYSYDWFPYNTRSKGYRGTN